MSLLSLASLFEPVAKLASEIIEDPDQRNRLVAELQKAEASIRQGQIALNQTEASHASLFVAGWRPAIGWLGVVGLGYAYFIQPVLAWVSEIFLLPHPPVIDLEGLYPLILGMLGLGAARTVEKIKHVARAQ